MTEDIDTEVAALESDSSMDSGESPGPGGDHWRRHAQQWDSVGPPLRPDRDDVAVAQRLVHRARRMAGGGSLRIALLGVTPELAGMAWPQGSRLLPVDRSVEMIRGILPRRAAVPMMPVCAGWLQLPLGDDSLDCVVGDGCFTVLEHVEAHRRLCRELCRVLRPGGCFVIRLFVQSPERESPAAVFDELAAGTIGSFHVFKWRLAMALHDNLDEGIPVRDIWRRWSQAGVAAEGLAARLGWSLDAVRTIEVYRDSPARYTFPTLDQAREVLAEHFEELECHVPAYELGDRCPSLLLRASG